MSKTLKRKYTEGVKLSSKKRKVQQAARNGPIVRGEALKWKEVTLPDRLEDAEGFYGLEEIEDVELVKTEDGLISFRPKKLEDVIVGEGEVAGEEWEGFGDGRDDVANEADQAKEVKEGDLSSPVSSQQKQPNVKAESSKEKAPKRIAKASKVSSSSKPAGTGPAEIEDEIDFNALDEDEEILQVDVTAWKELGLSPDMLSAISSMGFSEPTPIQKAAVVPIRNGLDVIGKAVTGSGKTLAFGIPIMERWLETTNSQSDVKRTIPTAFILAPTRELAHQLSKHLAALSRGLESSPRIATVTGGLALVKQQRQLEHADIIVGTPGRLWEVINSSHGLIDRLKQIDFLVIDEADRLLSEGHFKEVEEILDVLNRKVIDENEDEEKDETEELSTRVGGIQQRQTLVFSATFHKGLQQKLASKQKWQSHEANLLSNSQSLEYLIKKLRFQPGVKPTFVDANPTSSMAENLSESILECGAMQKDLYLYSLLLYHQHEHTKQLRKPTDLLNPPNVNRTLVFTNSISTVKRLVPLLSTISIPNTTILPLHSTMPQKSRLRSLERFTTPPNPQDTSTILIATDVAARGLDIKGVNTVIHYHVPRTADMYVHRSGRTARALSSGRSILICSPDEVVGVTRLISKVHLDHSHNNPTRTGTSPKAKLGKSTIEPFYLPANLPSQLSHRVGLAQKVTETSTSTAKSKTEDHWLRNAAEELGVDYESDEFDANSQRGRRGRGGGREKKRKEAVSMGVQGKLGAWKGELKDDLKSRKVDFGDGEGVGGFRGRFLAGGAVDMEKLLKDGV